MLPAYTALIANIKEGFPLTGLHIDFSRVALSSLLKGVIKNDVVNERLDEKVSEY